MHSGPAPWRRIAGTSLPLNGGTLRKRESNNTDGQAFHLDSPNLFGQVLEQVLEESALPPR
jgi:hypothetical protein